MTKNEPTYLLEYIAHFAIYKNHDTSFCRDLEDKRNKNLPYDCHNSH